MTFALNLMCSLNGVFFIIELKSFNKAIVDFGYRLTRYLLTQEVIITSDVGLNNYLFF